MILGFRISKNYFFEFASFIRIMEKHNWAISFETELIKKQVYDHTPRFHMIFILLKWTVFEVNVYNINHLDEEEPVWIV